MSGFFTIGEIKDRPGVYYRYENAGSAESDADEGIGAVVGHSDWGPLNTPVHVTPDTSILAAIGSGDGVDAVTEMMHGGCNEVVFVRIGSGGTKPTITFSGITLTAKYPSSRLFSITVKETLEDASVKKFVLYEGSTILETKTFTADANATEAQALATALENSKYVDVVVASSASTVAETNQASFTAGVDPTSTISSYSAGFEALEPEYFNVLCVDSTQNSVHAMVEAFLDRIYEAGAFPMAIVAEDMSIAYDTRMTHAATFNDEKMVYLLNGFVTANGAMRRFLAAARIGGMIAASDSNTSLTHQVIADAIGLDESFTNTQIIKGLKKGCLILSLNSSKEVMIEKAITTLVSLGDNQDRGWKKIRRVKTRMELMRRIQNTVDALIGKVDNDEDGRATIIAAIQRVLDAMIGEKKLSSGTANLDETNAPYGDSAWFVIAVDDLDSIETIYLTYQYRFAVE